MLSVCAIYVKDCILTEPHLPSVRGPVPEAGEPAGAVHPEMHPAPQWLLQVSDMSRL
jgi:hypothetical protein